MACLWKHTTAGPTKVEGNLRHPANAGTASGYVQASILGLYDPDRSQTVLKSGRKSSWETHSHSHTPGLQHHFCEMEPAGGRCQNRHAAVPGD
ncbi:MAG: hypothetical protein LC130_21590 [Bryobacterales bacterium]|nr:hypothetical protein [Bryobacterales bacterium]